MPTPNQPGPYDAVLGGAPTAPHDGVVLGGLDGVRQQLRAPDATVRAAALPKALTYGEAGLDLVIEVLQDDRQGLADEAYEVLRQRPEAKAKDAVARYEPLRSEKGIDYTHLRDLLKAGKWREADEETYEVMIRAVGKESGDWFESDELRNFPCMDLQTIDRMWLRYSQGTFGFSVQKRIYVECGAKLDEENPSHTIWDKFAERVGWRTAGNWWREGKWLSYEDLKANPSFSPAGEFPSLLGGKASVGLGLVGLKLTAPRASYDPGQFESIFSFYFGDFDKPLLSHVAPRLVNCSGSMQNSK